jgi:hypothetical protein
MSNQEARKPWRLETATGLGSRGSVVEARRVVAASPPSEKT